MRFHVSWLLGIASLLLVVQGCERAARYPAPSVPRIEPREAKPDVAHPHWSWHQPEGWRAPADKPIVFVAHGQKEWDTLGSFWTHSPHPVAGTRTIHLALPSFAAAAALIGADHLEATQSVLKVKVPLGLPDPVKYIPAANPVTFDKWKLGKKIFFARKLVSGADTYACATCHQPDHGFSEERGTTLRGVRNTQSLLNVAYNRRQFWDGRVATLEEVLVRTLDDELESTQKQPRSAAEETHRWGGLVRSLGADIDYRLRFRQVFNLDQPTQDAIAKALATYLRTILVGNSLYDRAEQERRRRNAADLSAEHFAAVLDDAVVRDLVAPKETRDSVASKLERGHRLFHTHGCVACHPPPLFTDQDYHNLGIGDSGPFRPPGEEIGHFVHVPIGLKEARLVGAFRTPTLRALPRTAPYFHDGSHPDLRTVVKYFNHSVNGFRTYLAPVLLDDDGRPRRLDLSSDDEFALVLFLRALDGAPVDGIVAAPPR